MQGIKVRTAEKLYAELKRMPTSFIREQFHHYNMRYCNLSQRKVPHKSETINRFRQLAWEQIKALSKILRERNEWDETKCYNYKRRSKVHSA